MGTSSSNMGPKGTTPLLPSWFKDTDSDDNVSQTSANDKDEKKETIPPAKSKPLNSPSKQEDISPTRVTGKWGNPKGAFSRFANRTDGSSKQKAARSYVRTLGGSRGAVRSARIGIQTGARYANFLGGISSNGFVKTLQAFGLTEFIGKSSEEILVKIADAIAPTGATNDEAIARDSIITTLDILYERIISEGKDITALETLSAEMAKESVIEYVSIFIFMKWVYELGLAIERNTISEEEAVKLEQEIKDFIKEEVVLGLEEKEIADINIKDSDNQNLIKSIFEAAYSTIEQ